MKMRARDGDASRSLGMFIYLNTRFTLLNDYIQLGYVCIGSHNDERIKRVLKRVQMRINVVWALGMFFI